MINGIQRNSFQLQGQNEAQQIDTLAKEFESVFLNFVLRSMRSTVEKSDLFGDSTAENLYREMLDTETARVMAEQGSSGLASQMSKELLKSLQTQQERISSERGGRIYQGGSLAVLEKGKDNDHSDTINGQ